MYNLKILIYFFHIAKFIQPLGFSSKILNALQLLRKSVKNIHNNFFYTNKLDFLFIYNCFTLNAGRAFLLLVVQKICPLWYSTVGQIVFLSYAPGGQICHPKDGTSQPHCVVWFSRCCVKFKCIKFDLFAI